VTKGGYRTVFTESARAEIRKLSREVAIKILRKVAELETDPFAFSTTALVRDPNIRRLRVGEYRVFYTVDQGVLVVTVIQVANRSVAYD
jgi:mRNA interferase RelE/StbE